MNFNPFKKGGGSKNGNTLERILNRFAAMEPSSVNCSLIKGEDHHEDLERAFLFKYTDKLLVQNKAIYITTPDGMKAQENALGKGEILHLWFLFNRVPHTVDCRVLGRIRFPDHLLDELMPRIPIAYMLRPVGNIRKIEKRQYLRYAHKVGQEDRRVYTQIMFDFYVTKTDLFFPETGSLPPSITDIHTIPHAQNTEVADQTPEEVVTFMKNAIRLNSRESRVVFAGKPSMEERSNKVRLLEMGEADMLGLETLKREQNKRQEASRIFYIRKPPHLVSDKRSPYSLTDGDTLVLNFHTSVSADMPTEYYDLVCEVSRVGTENLTVRTGGDIRKELGIAMEVMNFSIGGIKMNCSSSFMNYVLGDDEDSMPMVEKVNALVNTCYLLNFYPKLRFNRETEVYKPNIPMKIQILSKIVRVDSSHGILYEGGNLRQENLSMQDGELPQITGFGIKFYYDPAEYSRDSYSYDRWELIRDFKENRHFQDIHTSLNGLIAFLESQHR